MLFFCDLKKGAEMKRRKILAVNATALVAAAAFSVMSPAVAQNTSVQVYGHPELSIDDITKGNKESTTPRKGGVHPAISGNPPHSQFPADPATPVHPKTPPRPTTPPP